MVTQQTSSPSLLVATLSRAQMRTAGKTPSAGPAIHQIALLYTAGSPAVNSRLCLILGFQVILLHNLLHDAHIQVKLCLLIICISNMLPCTEWGNLLKFLLNTSNTFEDMDKFTCN